MVTSYQKSYLENLIKFTLMAARANIEESQFAKDLFIRFGELDRTEEKLLFGLWRAVRGNS